MRLPVSAGVAAVLCLSLLVGACRRDQSGVDEIATRPPAGPADPDIRHVILISIDTLRADHLACYGHPFVRSPNIDRFAAGGILFEQAIAAAPTTLASHTSLLTGTYPHTHGTPRNSFVVNRNNVTLAEVLDGAGFTTAAFIASFALDSRFKLDQGFEFYDDTYDLFHGPDGAYDQNQRLAARVTDAVIDWLDKHQPQRVFLFIHYFDVHWPYTPPPPYDRMYRRDDLPLTGSLRDIGMAKAALEVRAPQAQTMADVLDALYCGEVSYTDEHLGRLLDDLRQRGILEQSLLVITADHGETMDEHWNFFNHGLHVYDTTVRVPLIIRQPGGRGAGTRCARLVSNIDIMPTILDRLNIVHPERIEGESFARLLDGQTMPPRLPVFAEATQPWNQVEVDRTWYNALKSRAVRTEQWKYTVRSWDRTERGEPIIRDKNPIAELYDLAADPDEQQNLVGSPDPQARQVLPSLRQQLDAWARGADPLPSHKDVQPDTIDRLRELGYVESDTPRQP